MGPRTAIQILGPVQGSASRPSRAPSPYEIAANRSGASTARAPGPRSGSASPPLACWAPFLACDARHKLKHSAELEGSGWLARFVERDHQALSRQPLRSRAGARLRSLPDPASGVPAKQLAFPPGFLGAHPDSRRAAPVHADAIVERLRSLLRRLPLLPLPAQDAALRPADAGQRFWLRCSCQPGA